jgi:hypothetical protein
MKILFINNNGGGFADHIEVEEGFTVKQLFEQRMPGCKPENYLIRVNRLPASSSQVLVEGDRVSVTPVKIEGAH